MTPQPYAADRSRAPAVEGVLLKYAHACQANPLGPLCCIVTVMLAGYLGFVALIYLTWLYLLPYSLVACLTSPHNLGECYHAGLWTWWAWLVCAPFWAGVATPIVALYKATTA